MKEFNLEIITIATSWTKRGFRIELGEIEHALLHLEGIQQAVVIDLQHNGEKQLAAYYVANQGTEHEVSELIDQLGKALPDYMIPSSFTALEAIPITQNGKLNRAALPKPNWQNETA